MTPDPDELDDLPPASSSATASGGRGGMLRRTVVLAVVAVLAVVVGVVVADAIAGEDVPSASPGGTQGAPQRLDAGPRSGREDAPLPDLALQGFAGAAPVDLAGYRGAPLVVNFWATWCAPCVEEMPDIQRVADALDGRAAVLGVNVQDAPSNAEPFVDELGVTYDLAVDPAGELYTGIRGFGMPTTLLVDDAGTIVYRHTGPLDDRELLDLVATHLGVDVASAADGIAAGSSRQAGTGP